MPTIKSYKLILPLCLLSMGSTSVFGKTKPVPVTVTVVGAEIVQASHSITIPNSGNNTTTCVVNANGTVTPDYNGGAFVNITGVENCRSIVTPDYSIRAIQQSGYIYASIGPLHFKLYARPSLAAALTAGAVQGAAAGAGSTSFGDGMSRGAATSQAHGAPLGTMLAPGTYEGELNGSTIIIHYVDGRGKNRKAKYTNVGSW